MKNASTNSGEEEEKNPALILFPNQLFEHVLTLSKSMPIFIVEEELLFSQFDFHIQKILLHRISAQKFSKRLEKAGFKVETWNLSRGSLDEFFKFLAVSGFDGVQCYELTDDWLSTRTKKAVRKNSLKLLIHPTPLFLTPSAEIVDVLKGLTSYRFMPFYTWQRKRLKILVDEKGKPDGGQWSFDEDNRKKIPRGLTLPAAPQVEGDANKLEILPGIKSEFPDAYGRADQFSYPTTHEEARKWLVTFLRDRFNQFGPYEDAIHSDHGTLFHSVLTPALNTGLITPEEVVSETLNYAKKHSIPLSTVEGFIRQIIGWREYVRGIYLVAGRQQRSHNPLQHHRSLPESFWQGTTGLEPFDSTVKRVLGTAYCHHIERLMICGNLFLLCEIDPDEVYKWFMTLFIDAYDWVMVPNVYGMSQYADGGLMMTKPYVSSSNYILKMSNYTKGPWCEIWDGLYWRFIEKNRALFQGNMRTNFTTNLLDRMDIGKKKRLLQSAETFLESLER